MKKLLERVFITNWKTSLSALFALTGVVGRFTHLLDRDDMQYFVGIAVTAGLLAAKDGIREEPRVAREDVPGPDNPTPQP